MNIYRDYEDEINKYYRLVDVTQTGISYILRHLRYGRTLSNLVGRFIPIEEGKVETFAHRDVKKEDLLKTRKGYIGRDIPESIRNIQKAGSTWAIEPAMDFFVAPTIQAFLAQKNRGVCILEHIDAYPSDPFINSPADVPIITLSNRDVYFLLRSKEPTIDTIQETFGLVTSWSAIAFLSSMPTDMSVFDNSHKIDIDLESLEKIAKGTEKIIISAYDGEGYLIWSRSK